MRRSFRAFAVVATVIGALAGQTLPGLAGAVQAAPRTTPFTGRPTAAAGSGALAAKTTTPDSAHGVKRMCGTPKAGDFTCFALQRTDVTPRRGLLREAAVAPSGYGPADLRGAYHLPSDGGEGQTVAIVDAFDDPQAEADLTLYRQQYGLPACTTADGCFSKVDQRGGSDYPPPSDDWVGEISLDLDMVSAVAPKAHLLLVEADDASPADLSTAEDQAVALGAKFVSNSWGSSYVFSPEDPAETSLDPHFDHPGVAIVASAGDYGYGVSYPAASPNVTSVGGTSLVREAGGARGWSESVWNGGTGNGATGSGCSLYEPKPAFQTDTGCGTRTVADVSAVADPATGPAVYDSSDGGWIVIGGTSASAPIIAGVYADAGTPAPGTRPVEYPYLAKASDLNDVTSGSDGTCSVSYLCTAGTGYDGPTGLGTPNGLDAFRLGPHGEVTGTVSDKAGAPIAGAVVSSRPYTATTDAHGVFTLTVKTGTYPITVDAYGYAEATASADVSDGGTVHLDLTLRQLAVEKVAGTVTDGAGHGWPLYAKINVKGVPGGPVYTDPGTGAYSLRLPEDHTYTLQVTSEYPGYQPATRDVVVGKHATKQDFALPGDTWALTNPGYTRNVKTASTESFDSTGAAPRGWSVVNAPGTTDGWVFDDPGDEGNQTGGDGNFAIADSNYANTRIAENTELISPPYDLSADSSPELSFDTAYHGDSEQTGDVDITTDGGRTWTNLWHQDFGFGFYGPSHVEIALNAFAGQSAVQIRFHYVSPGVFWELDNVAIAERSLTPVPGGMLIGTVIDANTGKGIVGATVSSPDGSVHAVTAATPDDPGTGDGFYDAFAPGAGKHPYTVTMRSYLGATAAVKVRADKVSRRDFTLKAGQFTVSAGPISGSVESGHKVTRTLTLKNTGSAPATWTAIERSGTSPGSPAPASAWKPIADLPIKVYDNAVDTVGQTVYSALGTNLNSGIMNDLYAYDPRSNTWSQRADAPDASEQPTHGVIDGRIYYTGGWAPGEGISAATQIYDPATNTWATGADEPHPYGGSAGAVLDSKLYVVGGCGVTDCGTTEVQVYDPTTDTWSQGAAYPEPISWGACGAVDGKLYCAGGEVNFAPVQDAFVYDPASDSWSKAADLPIVLAQSSYTAANGQLLLSGGFTAQNGNFVATARGYAYDPQTGTWSTLPDAPAATTRGGGSSGMYRVGGTTHLPNVVSTAEVLRGYDQIESDVSWLSESPRQLTLKPGQTATISVTLNAAGLTEPGSYTATLEQSTDTPYTLDPLPVSLRVTAAGS